MVARPPAANAAVSGASARPSRPSEPNPRWAATHTPSPETGSGAVPMAAKASTPTRARVPRAERGAASSRSTAAAARPGDGGATEDGTDGAPEAGSGADDGAGSGAGEGSADTGDGGDGRVPSTASSAMLMARATASMSPRQAGPARNSRTPRDMPLSSTSCTCATSDVPAPLTSTTTVVFAQGKKGS